MRCLLMSIVVFLHDWKYWKPCGFYFNRFLLLLNYFIINIILLVFNVFHLSNMKNERKQQLKTAKFLIMWWHNNIEINKNREKQEYSKKMRFEKSSKFKLIKLTLFKNHLLNRIAENNTPKTDFKQQKQRNSP